MVTCVYRKEETQVHRFFRNWQAALMTLVMLSLLSATRAQAQDQPSASFDSYVTEAMKNAEVPGLAIAVVKDDRIVFSRGYGVRKLGSQDKVDERTVFAVGSTTKAFTAALVAMLVDEGKIKWDGRAADYLKGFEFFSPYVSREATITDLLSHRAGLPGMTMLWYASPFSRKEILERVRYQPLTHGFRDAYDYQNIMFLAAGEAAATVAGKSWDDLIKERIFAPLGMTSSTTSTLELSRFQNLATPHGRVDGKLQAVAYRNLDNCAPAGSINANVIDMAQWVRLQLNGGKYAGKQLISPEQIEAMWTPQIRVPMPPSLVKEYGAQSQFAFYARGWVCQDIDGHRVIWHTGGIDGMRAFVGLLPEQKVGFVILSNSEAYDQCHDVGLGFRLFDHYLGLPEKDWCAVLLGEEKEKQGKVKKENAGLTAKRVHGTKPSVTIDKYTGKYRHDVYGDIDIGLENNKLRFTFGPQRVADLSHWNYDTFKINWKCYGMGDEDQLMTFVLDAGGKVQDMSIPEVGVFSRVADDRTGGSTASGRLRTF